MEDEKFKDQAAMIEANIEDLRTKLGDDAALISNELLGIQSALTQAAEVHTQTLTDKEKLDARNKELLEVNNNLFIRNSSNIAGDDTKNKENLVDLDEEDAVGKYIDLKAAERKR